MCTSQYKPRWSKLEFFGIIKCWPLFYIAVSPNPSQSASQPASQSIKRWHKFHYNCTCCMAVGYWANRPHTFSFLWIYYYYYIKCVNVISSGLVFDCLIEHKVITKMNAQIGEGLGRLANGFAWFSADFVNTCSFIILYTLLAMQHFGCFLSRNFELHGRYTERQITTDRLKSIENYWTRLKGIENYFQ